MMHKCPNCQQDLEMFAFYCPRCRRAIGEMRVEGDMLAIWWLDAQGEGLKKWGVRTLRSGGDYLNLLSVSPARPSADSVKLTIRFKARSLTGAEQTFDRSAVALFAELARRENQEWEI